MIGGYYPYGTGWAGNTGYSFDGSVDNVRIYAAALTSSEIQKLYAWGKIDHEVSMK